MVTASVTLIECQCKCEVCNDSVRMGEGLEGRREQASVTDRDTGTWLRLLLVLERPLLFQCTTERFSCIWAPPFLLWVAW